MSLFDTPSPAPGPTQDPAPDQVSAPAPAGRPAPDPLSKVAVLETAYCHVTEVWRRLGQGDNLPWSFEFTGGAESLGRVATEVARLTGAAVKTAVVDAELHRWKVTVTP